MASLNKVLIMGNLGQDPEVKRTQAGKSVATLSIATTLRFKDEMGNSKDFTEWHRVIAWGRLAENCGRYLKKGGGCFVEGRIQTRKYKKKDGTDAWSTEIIAENLQFLSAAAGDRSKNDGASAIEALDVAFETVDYPDSQYR